MARMADDALFRDHAANERTLLAWIRTGVALMAFGFAIARFGLFLREIAPVAAAPSAGAPALGSGWFGVVLLLFGFVTNLAAMIRYLQIRTALLGKRASRPAPRRRSSAA